MYGPFDSGFTLEDILQMFLKHRHNGNRQEGVKLGQDGLLDFTDGDGPILISPNGTKYRLGVDNDGVLTTTPL